MEKLPHPAMDRGRRLAVELLVEDRLEQGFERRGRSVKAQLELANSVDQCAQLGIACA